MALGFKIADAYVELTLDRDELNRAAQQIPGQLGPQMDRAGQESGKRLGQGIGRGAGDEAGRQGQGVGDKLSAGIHMAVVRNSPLIVAGIGAALAAGAPVAIAGAAALFAGIGIVAAAQSELVQQAWSKTWTSISTGAQQDAAVLVPTLTRAADTIGASFQRMRPLLQDAFSASAPLIDTFVSSVAKAAETALPGLVRAVESAGPVFDGLGSLMVSVGDGLGEFFTILSQHAPAAGQAFAAIGDILGELLPILGELLGQGAELAATVLPGVASALGVVRSVVQALGPALPAIVAGFAAASIAGGQLSRLGDALGGPTGLAARLGSAESGLGKFGRAVGVAGAALPVVGAGIGLVVGALQESDRNIEKNTQLYSGWHQALLEGGAAAETAAAQFAQLQSFVDDPDSAPWFMRNDFQNGDVTEALDAAAAATKEYWQSLTPLAQAQSDVSKWSETLAHRLDTLGPAHASTQSAADKLAAAEQRAAEAQAELDRASSGLSITLEQAQAAADGLSGALETLNGGQLDMNEAARAFEAAIDDANAALVENGQNLDINTEAGRENAAALDEIAAAGMASAEAVYRQTGNYDAFRDTLIRSRDTLYDQARAFGMSDEAARAYVDSVLAIPDEATTKATLTTDEVNGQVSHVLELLKGVPPGVEVNVGVLSEQATLALSQLGYTVKTLPSGEVVIVANDQATPVVNAAGQTVKDLDKAKANPTITAEDAGLREKTKSAFEQLGILTGIIARPTADLDGNPFKAVWDSVTGDLQFLGKEVAKPTADLDPGPFNGVAAGVRQGLKDLAAQVAKPTADLNPGPFDGVAKNVAKTIADLGAQRPTPVASLTDWVSGPAASAAGAIRGIPTSWNTNATLTDWASGPARGVAQAIRNIPTSWSTTVTTYQKVVGALNPFAADGGSVDALAAPFMAMANRRDGGGPVTGPGGPTDDLVPALLGRTPFRLSNREWVIKASSSDKYGAMKMAAVNAGVAEITVPNRDRRAEGGAVDAASVANSRAMTVGDIHIHVNGVGFNGSKQDARRFAMQIRDEIIDLERSFK